MWIVRHSFSRGRNLHDARRSRRQGGGLNVDRPQARGALKLCGVKAGAGSLDGRRGRRVTLDGGHRPPGNGLGKVDWHANSVLIEAADQELRFSVAGQRRREQAGHRGRAVLAREGRTAARDAVAKGDAVEASARLDRLGDQ